jgi:predicted nucleic acid-binding protein
MVCRSCLINPSSLIIADASVVINLNATGFSEEILAALPNRLLVVDKVTLELENGRGNGNTDADDLSELVSTGHIELVRLGAVGTRYFEDLTIGSASETLDDGEAATIAYAMEQEAMPLIDERKANRICAARFPELAVGCTVDVLAHPAVVNALCGELLGDVVFNALHRGRMRVLPHHVDWVVNTIGKDRAVQCHSLPKSLRMVC